MITYFWNWMYQTVNSALSTLNTMYNNTIMKPFFDILIVVIATMVVIHFIIKPLIGGSSGSSDKAKRKDEEDQ